MTKTFEWTYNAGWTVGDLVVVWVDYWNQVQSNKQMGVILGNNALGAIWLDLWSKILPAQGFGATFTDLYTPGAEDYTQIITQLKKDGCELGLGLFTPPDFSNFWSQSLQQGWKPAALVVGIALNFPSAAASLGDSVINLGGAGAWSPAFPFASPILGGETCAQFAADYEEKTGEQWSHPLQHLLLFEWAADVFSRTTDLEDKAATLAAIRTTKIDTISGPLDFTEPISQKLGSSLNHPNNYKLPITADQWRKGTGKWPYDKVIVSNAASPNVPAEDKVQPIVYTS
jgi:branched-chain amino acid transport system substrate-binding protein